MRKIIILITSLFLCSCNGQSKSIKNFEFEILNNNSNIITDSTRIKLKYYFNDFSYKTASQYLDNIHSFKDYNNKSTLVKLLIDAERNENEYGYIPDRLKQIDIKGDNWLFNRKIVDTAFYQNYPLEQLLFEVNKYYEFVDNLKITRKEYDEDIEDVIKFDYNRLHPVTFSKNSTKLNITFLNISSKNVESFLGVLYITDNDNNNLCIINIDSKFIPFERVLPNQLKATNEIEEWYLGMINQIRYSSYDLRVDLPAYKVELLQEKYKKIRMIFIPTKIIFEDGSILEQ